MRESVKRLIPKRFRSDAVVIPVVRLSGMIGGPASPFRTNLTLESAAPLLKKAFARKDAPAVAIVVNSPGGSPVQSRLIYRRIRDLAEEKNKRVLVFVEDMAASGGYMIACAGDEILVDPSSVVGSIGVVSSSFGFVEALEKLGIERRVHTAGRNKALLDPFRPEREEDVAHLKRLQLEVHEIFIEIVKESRGSRLAEDDELFTGLFWSGRRGVELGLVDRIGDLHSTLRERYGETVKPLAIRASKGFFARRLSTSAGLQPEVIGTAAVGEMLAQVEERSMRARFGF